MSRILLVEDSGAIAQPKLMQDSMQAILRCLFLDFISEPIEGAELVTRVISRIDRPSQSSYPTFQKNRP